MLYLGMKCILLYSVLLHLLVHSSTQVKEHLNEYFVRSNRALSRKHIDNSVCLLIVKCFEVS